jgi:hypothetical protein
MLYSALGKQQMKPLIEEFAGRIQKKSPLRYQLEITLA